MASEWKGSGIRLGCVVCASSAPRGSRAVEDPRHLFQSPGSSTARLVGPLVQRSGDLAHGCAFAAQPPDLREDGLLGGIGLKVFTVPASR